MGGKGVNIVEDFSFKDKMRCSLVRNAKSAVVAAFEGLQSLFMYTGIKSGVYEMVLRHLRVNLFLSRSRLCNTYYKKVRSVLASLCSKFESVEKEQLMTI